MDIKHNIFVAIVLLLAATACHKDSTQDSDTTVDTAAVAVDTPFCDSLRLYAPGDYGSTHWRIPAILCLDDGTLLAVNDKRKYNHRDLPEDIDIVCRRSTDRGASWSEPQTIVQGTGYKHGYGDAALVQCANGDVLCFFVGGNGLWASTEADPIRSYVCRSIDRGATWGAPVELTSLLWGSNSPSPDGRWYSASFFASGNALRLTRGPHSGRVLVAAAMCRTGEQKLDNYVFYSDDNGHSWHLSDLAYSMGGEAKLIELADGRVLISVRRTGARGFNLSADGGQTWGTRSSWPEMQANACNGDMLRLDDTTILHSLPNSMERENVSIFISSDEGASWHTPVLLCKGPSVYSSLTRLPDGTVLAYVEKGPDTGCELWLYRFNAAWLRASRP